jgi:hypothetical protein
MEETFKGRAFLTGSNCSWEMASYDRIAQWCFDARSAAWF